MTLRDSNGDVPGYEEGHASDNAASILKVRRLSASYGSVKALTDVEIHVRTGEAVCVLGANGSGKSTLLSCIMGFIPYSGELYFGGMALDGLKTYQRAAGGIGLVPEGRRVFKTLTVQDNLIVGGSGSHASRSKVTPRIYDLFPLLYDRRNQTAGTMSGGEQQMLAIGRALIGEPKLLMLDEPSLGLAPAVIPLVYGAIDEIRKQGVSILLVEQNSVVALEATARGYVLDLGCVRVSGSSEELRSDPEVAAAYLG